ncbi:MAG: 50S ribosomal protein L2 [Patescibacteria group bacterium]
MAIKLYKPTTPGRRHAGVVDTSHLDKKRPERKLRIIIKKNAGRNKQGQITVRHQGGGAKQFYRFVDFKRDNFDIPGKVIALEYDPNRSAHIALIEYENGEKRYILSPQGLKKGDTIISSQTKLMEVNPGNTMTLANIPPGLFIHNIELTPGKGGVIARGAGMSAILQSVEGDHAQIKMPSGEIRLIKKKCLATIGYVGNADYRNVRLGKAGRKRHKGIRPAVTGKSMNPVDHPHGGGEGHQSIGLKYPKTPWGKHALGVKTRRKKPSDKFILQRRKKKK